MLLGLVGRTRGERKGTVTVPCAGLPLPCCECTSFRSLARTLDGCDCVSCRQISAPAVCVCGGGGGEGRWG